MHLPKACPAAIFRGRLDESSLNAQPGNLGPQCRYCERSKAIVNVAQHERGNRVMARVEDYEAQLVSKKILRIVLSYTDYVNRTVWKNSLN